MGYRHYLYQVDKELVKKIRECKTNEDLVKVCKDYFPKDSDVVYDCDDEAQWVSFHEMGKGLFEFGKYYENAEEICKHGTELFTSQELIERYSENDHVVLTEEGLLCAIEWQKNRIVSVYENLLREKSEDDWDDRTQEQRLKMHARDYLSWWKLPAVNLDKCNAHVARSHLYEHTIFDLVRIYKTFDWDKYCLVFIGS